MAAERAILMTAPRGATHASRAIVAKPRLVLMVMDRCRAMTDNGNKSAHRWRPLGASRTASNRRGAAIQCTTGLEHSMRVNETQRERNAKKACAFNGVGYKEKSVNSPRF